VKPYEYLSDVAYRLTLFLADDDGGLVRTLAYIRGLPERERVA
jgi:hypothetical protein